MVVLAGASLQAPLAHFHPEDPDHHHASGVAHTHLNLLVHHNESHGLEWESHDADEATIYLDWLPTPAQRITVAHAVIPDRKSTRLNSSHIQKSRMPSSA